MCFLAIVYLEPLFWDFGDKIKKHYMGKECGTYAGEAHTGFWWENLRERTTCKT
jgi:hypothetical protein